MARGDLNNLKIVKFYKSSYKKRPRPKPAYTWDKYKHRGYQPGAYVERNTLYVPLNGTHHFELNTRTALIAANAIDGVLNYGCIVGVLDNGRETMNFYEGLFALLDGPI